jgi:hypothetical protein
MMIPFGPDRCDFRDGVGRAKLTNVAIYYEIVGQTSWTFESDDSFEVCNERRCHRCVMRKLSV